MGTKVGASVVHFVELVEAVEYKVGRELESVSGTDGDTWASPLCQTVMWPPVQM